MTSTKLKFVPGPAPVGAIWYPDARRYDVYDGATLIGRVESSRSESWRKHGRIRTGKIGDPKHWEAYTLDGRRVGYRFSSRQVAAQRLLREVTL